MNKLFELFDRLTVQLPPAVVQMIRLGAMLLWFVLATIAVYYAWSSGSESVPPSGQDLSKATILERVQRERNLRNPPGFDIRGGRGKVTVPSSGELGRTGPGMIPYNRDKRPDAKRTIPESRDPRPGFSGQGRSSLPPYMGEGRNPFARRNYVPPKNAGTGGTTDPSGGGRGVRILPLKPGMKPARRRPSETRPGQTKPGQTKPASGRSSGRQAGPRTKPPMTGGGTSPAKRQRSLYQPSKKPTRPGIIIQ